MANSKTYHSKRVWEMIHFKTPFCISAWTTRLSVEATTLGSGFELINCVVLRNPFMHLNKKGLKSHGDNFETKFLNVRLDSSSPPVLSLRAVCLKGRRRAGRHGHLVLLRLRSGGFSCEFRIGEKRAANLFL